MEFVRRELRGDDGGAPFYASSSSGARYPSDAGRDRHGIAALGSYFHHDQVRQSSYRVDPTYLAHNIGTAGTRLRDPLIVPREDRELEIRRCRIREIAIRVELAHIRMLEEHDRRSLAIAERNPYARPIPFYPELPPNNSEVNHTASAIPHSRCNVQEDPNLGLYRGPQDGVEVPSILRREEAASSVGLSSLPERRDGEVVATHENKATAGSYSDKKIQPDVTQIPNEAVQTSENKENAGSSINRKRKLDSPPTNSKQKHDKDKPIKEEQMSLPKKKLKPASDTKDPGWIGAEGGWFCGLCKMNTLTKRDLDHHFQSDAHLDKLNALLNWSKKSEPVNKIVAEKPGQGVSQPVSLEKLEEPKEENSKSVHVPQSDKQKEVTIQDKGNPSSSNRRVIVTGHKMTKQPAPKFSRNKNQNENSAPGNSTSEPILVKQDGKWFCNLCKAKCLSEKNKEDHIKGKRHRENLQAQAMSQRPGPAKQPKQAARLHFCAICNISCTSKDTLIAHFNGKKHHYSLIAHSNGPNESVSSKLTQTLS